MTDSRMQHLTESFERADATLAWIKDREVTATPENYRLGYEYLINDSSPIGHQVARLEQRGEPLDQSLQKLYRQFFDSDNDERLSEFREALHGVVQQALSATSGTSAELAHYADHLSSSSAQLDQQTDDIALVRTVVNGLISETQRMDSAVKHLESDLSSATSQIDQLKQQYDQIRDEIFADPLTNVLNRRGLDSSLARTLNDNQCAGPHALLMVDLDNFKPLNDRYGHVVGDQVLCFIAKTLKNAVRGSDAVGRYGGDEFAVLLPDTPLEGGISVAENIVSALRKSQLKRRSTGELLGKITASIGVATSQPGDTPEMLFERADKALYRAKHAGKDKVAGVA